MIYLISFLNKKCNYIGIKLVFRFVEYIINLLHDIGLKVERRLLITHKYENLETTYNPNLKIKFKVIYEIKLLSDRI